MRSTATPFLLAVLVAGQLGLAAGPAHATAVGAVLGLNRGGISGDAPPDAEYNGKTGVIAGLQTEFSIAKDIALSLQPMYVLRGSGITVADSTAENDERDLELALDYVAIPVVVKISAAGGRTYVSGGLDVAFLSAATLADGDTDRDVKEAFHSVDVGALLGFGVVFPIGRPRLTVEARYVQGLVNLGDPIEGVPTPNLPDRFRSTGIQLTAGILFPLGRP
jgi:hypothetical protein